jgi:hypothetical protein
MGGLCCCLEVQERSLNQRARSRFLALQNLMSRLLRLDSSMLNLSGNLAYSKSGNVNVWNIILDKPVIPRSEVVIGGSSKVCP